MVGVSLAIQAVILRFQWDACCVFSRVYNPPNFEDPYCFKGKRGIAICSVEHVLHVLVDHVGLLVAVAVGHGEDAEDEEDVENQLKEDSLGKLLLLPPFLGRLHHTRWHWVRG